MSLNRYAKKLDENHRSITNALRMMGCTVEPHNGTEGSPDLICGNYGVDVLVEIKPDSTLKKHALREGQVEWHARWKGRKPVVLRTLDDCAELVAQLRGEGLKR